MGLPITVCDGREVVNTTIPNYNNIHSQLITHFTIATISIALLNKHLPGKQGIRIRTLFNCLVAVYLMDRASKFNICNKYNYNERSVSCSLCHLLELKLIRSIGKPRLIVPFQKFKVDVGYVITPLGEQTIVKILTGK